MNNIRSRYLQVFPLLAIAYLLITVGEIYFFEIQFSSQPDTIATRVFVFSFLKNLVLWAAIGWAFQKMKEAAIALGLAIIVTAVNYYFPTGQDGKEAGFIQYLSYALLHYLFVPVFVFAFLYFKKISKLTGFLFIWVIIYVFHIYSFGGTLQELSPYYKWFKFFQIEKLFEIHAGNKTFYYVNIFRYSTLPVWCSAFILISECIHATANAQPLRNVFKFDFFTRYSWPATLTLFYVLRISVNLLIVGLFMLPFSFFSKTPSYHTDLPLFVLALIILAGLLCLCLTVAYYRKFLIEYFIALKKKISWLYWLVNLPVVGLLAFPIVLLSFQQQGAIEERSAFYRFQRFNQNSRGLFWAMLAMNVVTVIFMSAMRSTTEGFWIVWLVEIAFFVWYSAAVSGYYALLITGGAGYIIFLIVAYQMPAASVEPYRRFSFYYDPALLNFPMSLCMLSAFSIVQYAVLMPVFHHTIGEVKQIASNDTHQIPA